MGQPKIIRPLPQESLPKGEPNFSLVLGGPLYHLYLDTRLARPPLELLGRRMVFISLAAWLPLFLLAMFEGHLTRGVLLPFLRDPEVHLRFLLALPLLIGAELYVYGRMRHIIPQFLSRNIIAAEDRARFDSIVASARNLRNSVIAEIILLVMSGTLGYWFWSENLVLKSSTWYAVKQQGMMQLTAAGWCYAFVSLTIFRFILSRWYYRLFIWYRFLWQVSSLPLHLNLYHPDRAGGLGFLSGSVLALAPVAAAQSILVAGVIYSQILYKNATLPSFKAEIVGIVVFLVILLLLPLGFFAVKLGRAERKARLEFGALASHYVDEFRNKWVRGNNAGNEPLLGTPDLQSLADLANSFAVVTGARLFPITKETLLRLLAVIIAPLLPLTLTMIPLDEVVKGLLKFAF